MPAVQVRDFPQDLYDTLKESASSSRRSVSQQIIHIVEGALCPQAPEPSTVREPDLAEQRRLKREKIFASIEAHGPITLPKGFPSIVDLVREDRDNR